MSDVDVQINRLNDGFGYGEGTISAELLREKAGPELTEAADTVINSGEILIAVDRDSSGQMIDDDGCGDGRKAKKVFKGFLEKSRSLNRAKVFGGGAAMTASTLIGLGYAAGKTVNQLFHNSIGKLKDHYINFGAHTAERVTPGREAIDSGCGAIDKAPEIIRAVVKYKGRISESISQLGIGAEGLSNVFDNYESYSNAIANEPYSGRSVIEEVVDEGKIVKQLEGEHVEMAIILNNVRNFTVNQAAVRKASFGKLDVFAVDVWRMQDYARKLYDNNPEQQQAFLSELVYTLATAAVLTKGDLATYVVEASAVPVAV